MDIFDIFVLFIIFTYAMLYVKEEYTSHEVEYITASDGIKYLVKKNENNQEVANKLATINKKFQSVVNHLNEKYPDDDRTKFVTKNYDQNNLSESTKDEKYTSYSLNKNKMIFCLKARNNDGTLIDDNTMAYVGFHELAHLATDEIGHTDKFWENFKWILTHATNIGAYNYVNYSANPQAYCGLEITSNILDS